MERYIRWALRFRFMILGLMVLITIGSGFIISQGVIATSMTNFLGETPKYADYLARVKQFSNDEIIVIAFEDDHLLSRPSLARLENAVQELGRLAEVRRVSSLLEVPDLKVNQGALSWETYADKARRDPARAPELLTELRADPWAGGLLVSRDGRQGSVIIELQPDPLRSTEIYPALIEQVMATFEQAGFERGRLHRTGMIAVLAEIINQTRFNIARLFPIVCGVLLLTVLVLFRRLWPVVITAVVALVGVIWTMGFAVGLFKNINLLMAMAPVFIMIVSFSDVIHLCSSYLLELGKGQSKDQAIFKSASEVGLACFYTSLTTFVGFAAIAFVPTPISRQLGIVLGFGVAVALLIALTLTPILFSLMPQPKPWRIGTTSRVQGLLDRALRVIARTGRRWPKATAAVFAVVIVWSLAGIPRFHFETDFVRRFAEDNPLMQDERYFAEHFAGTNYLDVFIETPEPDGLLDPLLFAKVAEFQRGLKDFPEVDKAISLVDVIEVLHAQIHAGDKEAGALPDTRPALSEDLFLLEMSDEAGLERMVDEDRRTLRLAVHILEDGVLASYRAGEKVRARAEEVLPSDVRVEVLGLNYLLGEWFDKVWAGQKRGLIFSFLAIMAMMAFMLRSLSAGFWAMVPNAIPLLAIAGYIGWFWDQADTDTIIVFMVAIGIAVDDTIHFLMRYRAELNRTGKVQEAVEQTFHYSGRAIVMTSVILVLGFAPFALSDYFTTRIMGTLMPATLVIALAADLFLMPAMIHLGAFRALGRKQLQAPADHTGSARERG
ncbi:MAG: hypothetical protein A2V67_15205 [Deltaproteobacteria bacterium RBG_13_61_14]|nr:MAG: hypothetical protein A2V67_15205 [Deltaproteobacteria bacterium RBG_13_61_14]